MNVLVVGYGSAGRRHVKNVAALGHVTAAIDTAAVEIPARLVVAKPWRWAEAVIIAAPAAAHHALAMHARRRHLPTLIEKPVTAGESLPVSWPGVPTVGVGYNLRFDRTLTHLRNHWLPRIEPRTATIDVRCRMSEWPGGAAFGDPLLECSHEVDLARWLFGAARLAGATADGAGRRWTLLLDHASGVQTTVVVDADAAHRRGGLVVGACGTARWRIEAHGRVVADCPPMSSRSSDDGIPFSYRLEAEAFCRAAAASEPFPGASLADGLAALDLCSAAKSLIIKGKKSTKIPR